MFICIKLSTTVATSSKINDLWSSVNLFYTTDIFVDFNGSVPVVTSAGFLALSVDGVLVSANEQTSVCGREKLAEDVAGKR